MCLTTVQLTVCVYPRALLSRWLSVASKGIGFLSLWTPQACVLNKVPLVSTKAWKLWGREEKTYGVLEVSPRPQKQREAVGDQGAYRGKEVGEVDIRLGVGERAIL